jgi:pimeloyl-ACP methyl ester carboxylesterase
LQLPKAPLAEPPDVALLLVHSGARGRLGSTFQYPFFARRFAELGYPSLRFDPRGVGESSGHIEITPMRDFYGSISVGRFVADTLVGIEELRRQLNPKRIVLFGVCGGAISALLAAPRSAHVDGLILLSPPVLIDSAQQSPLERIPAEYARRYLFALYAKKLLSPVAWKRLFSGKSDIDVIFTYARAALKAPLARFRPKPKGPERKLHPRFNGHFLEAVEAMLKRRARMLFMFGEGDALRWDFQKEFYDVYWKGAAAYEKLCQVHYVPGCNHLFTLREWERQALDVATPWLASLPPS